MKVSWGVSAAVSCLVGSLLLPAPTEAHADAAIAATFAEFAKTLPGEVAVAFAAPGTDQPVVLSNLRSDQTPAWGTIRIPLALTALRSGVTADLVSPLLTGGSAEASTNVWKQLGGDAASRVQDTLTQMSSPTKVAAAADYAGLAKTAWTPADQAKFAATLLCAPDRGVVTNPMVQASSDRSTPKWGLDRLTGAVNFIGTHGGWGPVDGDRFSARQIGLVQTSRGVTAVSLVAVPNDPGQESATQLADRVADWVRTSLPAIPASTCDAASTSPTAPAPTTEPQTTEPPVSETPAPTPESTTPAAPPSSTEPATPTAAPSTTRKYLVGARPGFYTNVATMLGQSNSTMLRQLTQTPVAEWVGGGDAPERLNRVLKQGREQGTVPVVVLYNIPNRDLGSHSGGGAANGAEYRRWIDDVSRRIGQEHIVLIVEPDAVPHMDGRPAGEISERSALLAYALNKLKTNPNVSAYLDAGHAGWPADPRKAAALLKQVSSKGATIPGISLNVSNFHPADDTVRHGKAIAAAFGAPLKIMVDNSRNGAPKLPNGWCNPAGQRLGSLPDKDFDAAADVEYAFIKTPGESDGQCGVSQARAGNFDPALLNRQIGR